MAAVCGAVECLKWMHFKTDQVGGGGPGPTEPSGGLTMPPGLEGAQEPFSCQLQVSTVAPRSVLVAPYLAVRGRGLTIKNSALRAGQKAVVEWMYERQKAGDEKAVSCLYWPDSSGEVSTCGLPGGAED